MLGRAGRTPVLVLTSHLPRPGTEPDVALRAAGPHTLHDVVGLLSAEDRGRLRRYGAGGLHDRSLPGFWSERDLG